MNRDEYGIIGQIQSDGSIEGGDSACWMGHWIYLTGENWDYVNCFEVAPGAYVRHPYPHATNNRFGAYYENPWMGCMSRDQLTGTLGALIARKERMALLRFFLHSALRGFLFTYNVVHNGKDPNETKFDLLKFFHNPEKENYYHMPDPTGPDFWATALRGFGIFSWLLFPLLCVLDLHMVLGTLFQNKSEDPDAINFTLKLLVSRDYVPTPVSWLAVKLLDKAHLIKLLEEYWCGWREGSEMYELQKKRIEELR